VTPERRRRYSVALAIVASACFALLAHASIIDELSPAIGALLSLVPLAAVAAWLVRPKRHPIAMLVALSLAAAALWWGWTALERHFSDLFFVEHAGMNLLLAVVFGRTLAPGREPLCTRFATLLHGPLPPDVARYTRRVTAAWTAFFLALFTASCVLYLGGFLAAWSLLANILSPLLVVAMFAVEYGVRLRSLPHWERAGILSGIRAFTRQFAAERAQAQR
jgi:uncharacterized membrane protein